MPATIAAPVSGTVGRNTSAGTTLAVPYPSGVQLGYLLELQANVSSATAPTTPSGWTLQVDLNAGGSSPSMRVWTRIADATDVTASSGGSNKNVTTPNATSQGRMRYYTNVDPNTPVDAVIDATHGTYSSSSSATAFTIQATTTALANTMASVVGAGNSASGSWTPPTSQGGGWTETWDDITTTPKSTHDYLLWTGSGATGTVNLVASVAVRGCAAVIFYRPAPSLFALTGEVDGASALSGSIGLAAALAGSVAGASALSGSPCLAAALTGTVAGVSGVSGSIGARLVLTGTVAGTSGLSGSIQVLLGLTGTVAGTSAVTGAIALLASLNGTVSAVSSVSGTPAAFLGFTGVVPAVSEVTGQPFALLVLSGTVVAVSTVSGDIGVSLPPIPVSFRLTSHLRVPTVRGHLSVPTVTGHLRVETVEGDTE